MRSFIFVTYATPLLPSLQKIKFSIENFFSECDKIHRKILIWSHLMKKPLTGNFTFYKANISGFLSQLARAFNNIYPNAVHYFKHYLKCQFLATKIEFL